MSTPSGVPQAPVSAGGVEGQAAVIGEVQQKEMYSLRFDGTSYLSRTFGSSATNNKFTISMWVKRSALASAVNAGHFMLMNAWSGNNNTAIKFAANSQLPLNAFSVDWSNHGVSTSHWRGTQAVFRDTISWYHLIWNFDNNPFKNELWVNGSLDTTYGNLSGYSNPNSTQINDSLPHNIGRYPHTNSYYFNGYLANIHFIDGEALEPSSFGELISDVWRPASYSGDYGVNGFHLDFDPDNMVYDSNGKLTQVKDASGNDNHWTAN